MGMFDNYNPFLANMGMGLMRGAYSPTDPMGPVMQGLMAGQSEMRYRNEREEEAARYKTEQETAREKWAFTKAQAELDQAYRDKQLALSQQNADLARSADQRAAEASGILNQIRKNQLESAQSQQLGQKRLGNAMTMGYGPQKPGLTGGPGNPVSQPGMLGLAMQAYPDQAGPAIMGSMFPTPNKPTGPMQDAAAMGLTPGSPEYIEYIRDRTLKPGSQTNVNNYLGGSPLKETPEMISKGEFFQRDSQGNIVFENGLPKKIVTTPGGKTDRERMEEERKATNLEESRSYYGGVVIEDSMRGANLLVNAMKESDRSGWPNMVAGWGGLLDFLPSSDAKQLSTYLTTMKANIGFDRLQVMRQNSPSGGALGNVSNFEVGTLQATQGNLDQTQKPEELLRNIIRINAMYAATTSRKKGLVDSAKLDSPDPNVSGPEKKKFSKLVDEIERDMRKQLGLDTSGPKNWRYDKATGKMEPAE